jgi:purine-binding chemotaxis protein CheW
MPRGRRGLNSTTAKRGLWYHPPVPESGTLCTFTVTPHLFGVDTAHVQEIVPHQAVTRIPMTHDSVAGLVSLRGQIMTAIDLRKRLQLPPAAAPGTVSVVLRSGEGLLSLIVDRVEDVRKSAGNLLPPPPMLSEAVRQVALGVAPGEGRLLLVLDAAKLCRTPSAAIPAP